MNPCTALKDISEIDKKKLESLYLQSFDAAILAFKQKYEEIFGKNFNPKFKGRFEEYLHGKRPKSCNQISLTLDEFIASAKAKKDFRLGYGLMNKDGGGLGYAFARIRGVPPLRVKLEELACQKTEKELNRISAGRLKKYSLAALLELKENAAYWHTRESDNLCENKKDSQEPTHRQDEYTEFTKVERAKELILNEYFFMIEGRGEKEEKVARINRAQRYAMRKYKLLRQNLVREWEKEQQKILETHRQYASSLDEQHEKAKKQLEEMIQKGKGRTAEASSLRIAINYRERDKKETSEAKPQPYPLGKTQTKKQLADYFHTGKNAYANPRFKHYKEEYDANNRFTRIRQTFSNISAEIISRLKAPPDYVLDNAYRRTLIDSLEELVVPYLLQFKAEIDVYLSEGEYKSKSTALDPRTDHSKYKYQIVLSCPDYAGHILAHRFYGSVPHFSSTKISNANVPLKTLLDDMPCFTETDNSELKKKLQKTGNNRTLKNPLGFCIYYYNQDSRNLTREHYDSSDTPIPSFLTEKEVEKVKTWLSYCENENLKFNFRNI